MVIKSELINSFNKQETNDRGAWMSIKSRLGIYAYKMNWNYCKYLRLYFIELCKIRRTKLWEKNHTLELSKEIRVGVTKILW